MFISISSDWAVLYYNDPLKGHYVVMEKEFKPGFLKMLNILLLLLYINEIIIQTQLCFPN